MDFVLKEIDMFTSSQEEIDEFIGVLQLIQAQIFPEDPREPDEVILRQLRVQIDPKEMTAFLYLVQNAEQKNVGAAYFGWFAPGSARQKGNEMIAFVEIQILPDYRKNGVGSGVYNEFISKISEAGKKVVVVNTTEKDGKTFLTNRGFKIAMSQPIYRTKFDNVDWNMIDNWIMEAKIKNPTTRLVFCDRIPDEMMDAYAKTYTLTHEQIPTGDLQFEDMEYTPEYLREREEKARQMGISRLNALAVEENGEITGFTYVNYSATREPIIDQGITAVLESARGRKLGKWLKASMAQKIKETYPKITTIQTDIATSNAPMISINERMGFAVHKELIMAQKMLE